jgi:hypothetical protein
LNQDYAEEEDEKDEKNTLHHLLQRNPVSNKVIKFFTGYFGYTQ